jgi:hypothetical protein
MGQRISSVSITSRLHESNITSVFDVWTLGKGLEGTMDTTRIRRFNDGGHATSLVPVIRRAGVQEAKGVVQIRKRTYMYLYDSVMSDLYLRFGGRGLEMWSFYDHISDADLKEPCG